MPKATTLDDLDLDEELEDYEDEYDGRTLTTVVLAKPINHDKPLPAGSKVDYKTHQVDREVTYFVDGDGKEIAYEVAMERDDAEERTRTERHWVGPDGEHLAKLIHIGVIASYTANGKRVSVVAARQRDDRQLRVDAERGFQSHLTNVEALKHYRTHRQTATVANERALVEREVAAIQGRVPVEV
jgi:hypothetical protein